MKKRLFSLLLVSALVFTLSGCREKSLLRESDPVTLNFWHVYGEQSGSPVDLLVQEFNRTVGQEKGVRVQVTNLSSASKIGGFLKEAQKGGRDAPEMPDLFTAAASPAFLRPPASVTQTFPHGRAFTMLPESSMTGPAARPSAHWTIPSVL